MLPEDTERTLVNLDLYYKVITTVERDTGKYHEFIADIVYECAARVNNTGGNERVRFPRYRVHTVVIMYANAMVTYEATPPRNNRSRVQSIATTSLVPRPSYEKNREKVTCIEPVYARNYSRAPIRFKNEVT